jgi:hypothetical protein
MAWRGTPKISMASQYKSTGVEPVRTKKKTQGPRTGPAPTTLLCCYKRSGYATRFFMLQPAFSSRQKNS